MAQNAPFFGVLHVFFLPAAVYIGGGRAIIKRKLFIKF